MSTILAAVLFPVFARAREKARQITCVSNMRQLALGISMYATDYDETYPFASTGSVPYTGWPIRLQPYLKNSAILLCPSDIKDIRTDKAWAAPRVSYAVNGLIGSYVNFNRMMGVIGILDSGMYIDGVRTVASVGRPSDTILLAELHDEANAWGWGPGTFYYSDAWIWQDWGNGVAPNNSGNPASGFPRGPNGGVPTIHSRMADFAFCDGHVRALIPITTNPDRIGRPNANMWDALRE